MYQKEQGDSEYQVVNNDEYNELSNQNMQRSNPTSYVLMVFMTLFFSFVFLAIGFFLGKDSVQENSAIPFDTATLRNISSPDEEVDFELFWNVWETLKVKYVDHDELDAQKMMYGAINGMLMSTGDPYTVFLDPEQMKALEEELNGSFEGVGAEIGIKDNILTIVSPLEGSPAMQAGLMAGDKIIEIDGENTAELTVYEAVERIRGEKGSEVVLKIYRDGDDESRDVTVTRDTIHIDSVKVDFIGDVAHLKIMQFGTDTPRELQSAVNQIKANDSKAIIVDMRNNPGGILDVAVEVSSKFLPNNSVVVSQKNALNKETKLYSRGTGQFIDIPVVVLINEGSASASEIVAGALKDNREDVVLVGEKSFGKGSVQELIPTNKNTAAKITIAKWFTPNGDQISEKGIEPDVETEYTIEDYENEEDPQLDKALEIIKEKILE